MLRLCYNISPYQTVMTVMTYFSLRFADRTYRLRTNCQTEYAPVFFNHSGDSIDRFRIAREENSSQPRHSDFTTVTFLSEIVSASILDGITLEMLILTLFFCDCEK